MSNRLLQAQSGPLAQGGHVALWGASSLIRSLQSGYVSGNVETPVTATITAVVPENCLLLHQGFNQAANTQATYYCCYIELTNATTITFTRFSAGGSTAGINWTLIEFLPGIVKSVQQGILNMGTNATLTATVAEVRPDKCALIHLGFRTDEAGGNPAIWATRLTLLLDGVTVRADRYQAGNAMQVSWRLVEFF